MTASKPKLRVLIVDDNRDGADALRPHQEANDTTLRKHSHSTG